MSKLIDPFGHKGPSKVDSVSCGITWVDGRCIFKRDKKWGKVFLGVCHYTDLVWAVTPSDYEKPLMITTIQVSPFENFCDKAHTCLYFACKYNRFNKTMYVDEFKDAGAFSLGLPQDIGTKPLWFNDGKWKSFWFNLIKSMKPEGGIMAFNEDKFDKSENMF